MATSVVCAASAAAASESEMGFVVSVHGAPMATDRSGQWRRTAVLQSVHDGEAIELGSGDSLGLCNEASGSSFRIAGPGKVSLSRSGVATLVGTPQIEKTGACDDATAVDSNGGVILRDLKKSSAVAASPPR